MDLSVNRHLVCRDRSLIDLHDHAIVVEKKGRREREISASIKQMTIDEVVNARYLRCRKQNREGKALFFCQCAGRRQIIDRCLCTEQAV